MAVAFSRTLRALHLDKGRTSIWTIGLVLTFLIAWGSWFTFAQVAVHESSTEARLVMGGAPVNVQCDVSGKVIASHIRVGATVRKDDVLLELDGDDLRREQAESESRLAGLAAEFVAVQQLLAAQQMVLKEAEASAAAAVEEAQRQLKVAQVAAEFSSIEATRIRELRERGDASELELLRANAQAESTRLTARVAEASIDRVQREGQTDIEARRVAIESLHRDAKRLTAEQSDIQVRIARLERQIERLAIRAPVNGRIGDAIDLRSGGFVSEGQSIATLITDESLSIVAYFHPAAAVGRVTVERPARMRFDGFPWGQFGSVPVLVSRVGQEPRDGRIRVECDLSEAKSTSIPLQHGLTGTLEVEVERISPAALVLRIVGGDSGASSTTKQAGVLP